MNSGSQLPIQPAPRAMPQGIKRPGGKADCCLPSRKTRNKVHPIICHEDKEVQQRYRFTLSLTSALDAGGLSNATPRKIYPREKDPVPIVHEAEWVPGPVRTPLRVRVRLHWSQNRHNTANQHLSGHTLHECVATFNP